MGCQISLYELNSLVQETIEESMGQQYWVEAELAEANERRGHLFLDLVQKDERSNTPIARASAKCWVSTWMPLRAHFERITGQRLVAGMKVLLCVYPQFHPAYGFSWIVTDIDPTYTLGDMARRRQEIVRQLKEEGVFDLQKDLKLPQFCQNIAVISSETAAGYGDFYNQLTDNEYGFRFNVQLFPAIMQGEQVEASVISALNDIYESHQAREMKSMGSGWDAVVIIRGGGATSDMSGFDTLALAENVANFPLPVITGIGHDRDECVLDMVAYKRVKTPTAVAAFLVSHLVEVAEHIGDITERITSHVRNKLEHERVRITGLSARIPMLFSMVRNRDDNRLVMLWQRLGMAVNIAMQNERHRMDILSQRVASLDPQLMLSRGYSMTMSGGKIIRNADQLMDGEIITTRLANGEITSKVWKKQ